MDATEPAIAGSERRTLHYLNSKFKASLFEVVSRSELLSATVAGLNRRFLDMTGLFKRVGVSLKASMSAFSATFDEAGARVEEADRSFSSIESVFDEAYSLSEALRKEATNAGEQLAVIDDIAETMSILSLNASIQAARAGGAGKAFAVVAAEIRRHTVSTKESIERTGRSVDFLVRTIASLAADMDRIRDEVRSGSRVMKELVEIIERERVELSSVNADLEAVDRGFEDYEAIKAALERMIGQSAVSKTEIERILLSYLRHLDTIERT